MCYFVLVYHIKSQQIHWSVCLGNDKHVKMEGTVNEMKTCLQFFRADKHRSLAVMEISVLKCNPSY